MFRGGDMFKVWNTAFAPNPCDHVMLSNAPGSRFVFDPPDGKPLPPFRFLPSTTTPESGQTSPRSMRSSPSPRS